MNRIIIDGDQARLYGAPKAIPTGQVGFSKIGFEFSSEWDGMTRIAQFRQGENKYNVAVENNECTCPNELVKGWVSVSVRGYSETAVIATANEILLPVSTGFQPGGIPPVPPTPDLYQQLLKPIQDQIGDLSDLTTEAKENLVAAINEAARTDGSTVELDTTLTQSGQAADAAVVGNWLSSLSKEIANIPGGKAVKMSNVLKVGTVFKKPEGLPYCGWPFNNLQYDPDLNAVVFLINAAVTHSDNGNTHLYMGKLDLDTYAVEIKEIGNPETIGHGFYTMGFCINNKGEYLYVDAQSQTLGKSIDKGKTWTETDISAYDNWPESITQLSNGRYLFWADGNTRGVLYSDNDCETWTRATMSNPKHEGYFLELPDGVVMCFMRKSTNGTDNGAWNGNKIQEPIVISISYDYGVTWTAATDSTTLLEGCANIATAFYHKDEDLVEVFTSPRYPYGDTMGAIWQYIASREDALNDKFGTPKAVVYSKAQAYQDFGHVGGCKDGNGDMHLMYYDGDASASGGVNYYYMKASRGQAVIPVHSNAVESLFLPYSASDTMAQIMAVRAELMAKINEIIIENGGTVEDKNFYITEHLKFDFDFTNAGKIDNDAGTITDTFGYTATGTANNVVIPAADYGAKMTDSSAITLELGILCHTENPSDFKLVEANTYLYDGWIINATKYHAVYTNTSGAVKTSTNTYYSPNISVGNYFLLSLVCADGGSVSMYVNGTLISEHTCTDFASYAGAIEKGVKVNDASAYYTNQHFRVYNKALTADEVKQNYNYFKVLHG